MISILLGTHANHPWFKQGGRQIRGWYESAGNLYHEASPEPPWPHIHTARQFADRLKMMNGNYGVILETETHLFAAVDRIVSYPLYYTRDRENHFCISDSLLAIKKVRPCVMDEQAREELLACGYILGQKTIYKDVYQLQGGQILSYDKETCQSSLIDYYQHIHTPNTSATPEELCQQLDTVILHTFQRMIRSIQGKTVALFLSGGYDSRLVATTLKRLNYSNVVCITLGGNSTKDATVGQEIAKQLDFPLIALKADKSYWREFRASGAMEEYFGQRAAHCAMPYTQGIYLKELICDGRIPEDCVAVTGNSGDVVEGEDVTHCFLPDNRYSTNEIAEAIRFRHFMLNGQKKSQQLMTQYDFSPYTSICGKTSNFTDEEAEEIIEFFNWRERQCKFVVNDVRNYDDALGIEWRLPLWDNEFVDFWLAVPYSLRYGRKLYYQYIHHEKLPTANNRSLFRRCIDASKKPLKQAVYPLYLPKALWNYFFSTALTYSTYGLLSFPELCKILTTNKGYRETQSQGHVRLFLEHL